MSCGGESTAISLATTVLGSQRKAISAPTDTTPADTHAPTRKPSMNAVSTADFDCGGGLRTGLLAGTPSHFDTGSDGVTSDLLSVGGHG